ncbi:MAG: LytTR family DNA-binding domain-containing protein [Blastocatellia bacterium]
MKLKTLISDDEASARSRLRKLLSAHPEVEIIAEAGDGLATINLIAQERPDLLLLDVQMPGLNGFAVLQAIPAQTRLPLVIFVTAYDEYALAAFEANALGYLLKPVNRQRLSQTLERAYKLCLSESQANHERDRIRAVAWQAATPLQQIIARKRDRFVLLGLEQIVCLHMEDGLLKVQTEAESYWTDYQLNELEARLPRPPFFRAHRAALVNLQRVKEIAPFAKSTYLLIMNDRAATEIQVSERQSKKLRQLLWG